MGFTLTFRPTVWSTGDGRGGEGKGRGKELGLRVRMGRDQLSSTITAVTVPGDVTQL